MNDELADQYGARSLLAEILKRAAFDWVLYRSSTRLKYKQIARDAYCWLFEEGPGHPDWEERLRDGWYCFSFLAICESLNLEPDDVREIIRRLTVKDVLSSGRPPTHRKLPTDEDSVLDTSATAQLPVEHSHIIEDRSSFYPDEYGYLF